MTARPRSDAVAGMRAMLPWLLAVAPFGLVIGVAAGQARIPSAVGWFTGLTIYGGSAQVAAIQMLDTGSAAGAVIATVLVINLRLVFYSAALARYWRDTPLWWRLLAGYLLVDPSFVVGVRRYADHAQTPAALRSSHTYYLGGAVVLWVGWLIALAVGAFAGSSVPSGLHLELLVPLYLLGQIMPNLRQPSTRRATLASGIVAAVSVAAPLHLGVAVGIVAGLVAGSFSAAVPATQETRA